MFDQNDQNQQAAGTTPVDPVATTAPLPASPMPAADPVAAPAMDASAFNVTPLVADPVITADPASQPAAPVDVPTPDPVMPDPIAAMPEAQITPTMPSSDPAPAGEDPLLSIKKDALQNLSPLLSHLDQTPEEKFRTTMMLIQASDDQSLVQAAYASAKEITDEKVRAQALLDIINEINYFTQQQPVA